MRWPTLLVVVFSVVCALSGCSSLAATLRSATDGKDRNAPPSAAEAALFGGVTLPQGVEVLGTAFDSGRDMRYRLALRVNDAQLSELVDQFQVKPRQSDIPASRPVIAGPALDSAPRPLYAEDRVDTAEHGPVSREIIVDERAPSEVYVHLSFFTT